MKIRTVIRLLVGGGKIVQFIAIPELHKSEEDAIAALTTEVDRYTYANNEPHTVYNQKENPFCVIVAYGL